MSLGTFLDGQSYSQLRGLSWLSLSDTGYRLTLSGTSDLGGGGSVSWGTAGTVACRIDPLTGGEMDAGGRISDRSTHQIMLPPNETISTNDRIQLSGGTYAVTAIRDRTSEWLRTVEAVQL